MSLQGRTPLPVCELPQDFFNGGAWSPDGALIVFGVGNRLYEVAASGGHPEVVVSPEVSEGSYGAGTTGPIRLPHFLPLEAGRRVVVFIFGSFTETTMMLLDLETGRRELLGPGFNPVYSPSGHIVYQPSLVIPELWALPFSLDTLKAAGEAFLFAANSNIPSVASDGTLVHLDAASVSQQQLVWRDRLDRKTGEIGQPQRGRISYPALSPDGELASMSAVEIGSSREDVWVWDIVRGVKNRVNSAFGGPMTSAWSPNGEELVFGVNRGGNFEILVRRRDGLGEEKLLLTTPGQGFLTDWSTDGKYILYEFFHDEKGVADLWYLERKEDGSKWESHPFLQTSSNERAGKFSLDGRYVAHVSNYSGQYGLYVQRFPDGGERQTLSSKGGSQPRWSRDELFFIEGNTLMAVSVSTHPGLSVGSDPTSLFPPKSGGGFIPQYDVSADGQRFVLREPAGPGERKIHVVQNWFAEFKDRQRN